MSFHCQVFTRMTSSSMCLLVIRLFSLRVVLIGSFFTFIWYYFMMMCRWSYRFQFVWLLWHTNIPTSRWPYEYVTTVSTFYHVDVLKKLFKNHWSVFHFICRWTFGSLRFRDVWILLLYTYKYRRNKFYRFLISVGFIGSSIFTYLFNTELLYDSLFLLSLLTILCLLKGFVILLLIFVLCFLCMKW